MNLKNLNPNNFGLLQRDLDYIFKALMTFPEIKKAVVFGSRSMGNYKKGSDIDIAIFGENISDQIKTRLSGILNQELPIPYFVDVLDYNGLSNLSLKRHIDTKGKVIYEKENSN